MTTSDVSKKIKPILKKYDIKKSAFFGSFARGQSRKNSDIDILIQPPAKMTFFGLAGLKIELEEKLGKKVDLITYKALNPKIKDRVQKDIVQIL